MDRSRLFKHGLTRYHGDEGKRPRRTYTIMTEEEIASGKKSEWHELDIQGNVKNLSPTLWTYTHLTCLYLYDNQLTRLSSEIKNLVNLVCLDASGNRLRSLPAEIGDLVQLRELNLSHNLLRNLPYEVGKLFKLQFLGLKGNPLTADILTMCSEPNGTARLLTFLLDHLTFSTPVPPQRPWLPQSHPDRRPNICSYTVMCYNVLCDKYATRQMYGFCPSWALSWEYRKKGIMDQIRHCSADIITLQEVETEQFYKFFRPELERDGYEGIFSPKSRAKTMCENERKHVDGCAIFYRVRKFKLVSSHLVEFNQLAMVHHEGSDDMLNRVMTKDNIGLAALLETREEIWEYGVERGHVTQPVLVCTCHIHWDPDFSDVKLIQTMMLMRELETIAQNSGYRFTENDAPLRTNDVNILICGDLNSQPGSGVTEFLTKRRISFDHLDFKGYAYRSCLKKLTASDKPNADFDHPFKLNCAYGDDVMPYTNYTYDFKGVIDYIFHSKENVKTLGILGPIDQNWMASSKIMQEKTKQNLTFCPENFKVFLKYTKVSAPRDIFQMLKQIFRNHFPLLCELEMRSVGALTPPQIREMGNGDLFMNGQMDMGNGLTSSSPSPANGMMGKR
ncbi:unnamed protein product [Notodromas monacha]|uniref:poly(A)-specific ribonuclease n=1 Tax=Notodromas monacha TaxID=399045 RepID=A0A7R9BBY8_9CRUS|nr:unnamed protein product [Notodromas monacha]CAG0912492.1 unnamed protein product [Notodromas monacha]